MAMMLDGVRVLDLTNTVGSFCGKVLADMGADVIKIEPPCGSDERSMPPFCASGTCRESLWWKSFNRHKRGVTLDVRTPSGLEIFRSLASTSQVVVQSAYTTGQLPLPGEELARLTARHVGLVCTSVTPYGTTGPRASTPARDIVLQGMGTYMYVTGDTDRPPVRIGGDVAYCHAGSQAAAATVLALYGAKRTGQGQVVDVSAQEAIVWTLLNTTMAWDVAGNQETRGGGVMRKERASDLRTRLVWRCQDGWVHFVPIGGGGGFARRKSYARLVEWMEQEGAGHPILRARDWNGEDANDISQVEYDEIAFVILGFLARKSRQELFDRALADGLLLAPIDTMADVLRNPQLAARGYWDCGADEDFPDVLFPGPFAWCSRTPLRRGGRAPSLGEHNAAIFGGELHLEPDAVQRLAAAGVL